MMKNLEQKLAALLVNDEKLGMVLWGTVKNDPDLISMFNAELFVEELVDNLIDSSIIKQSHPFTGMAGITFPSGYVYSRYDNRYPTVSNDFIVQWSTIQDNRKTMIWGVRPYRCRRTIKFILTHIINKELGIRPWTELNHKLNK